MNPTNAMLAAVQVLGIGLWMQQPPPGNGIQVVMPNMNAAATAAMAATSGRTMTGMDAAAASHVEEHVAAIVIPACAYVSSKGWAPTALEAIPNGQFLYVRLNREHVTFRGRRVSHQGAGGVIGLPDANVQVQKLPQAGNGPQAEAQTANRRQPLPTTFAQNWQRADVVKGLPHLHDCCPGMTALNPNFQPPGYPGAMAVVDFPAGVAANACHADAPGVLASRIDTVVTFPSTDDVVITSVPLGDGRASTKELVVRGTDTIYLVDFPASFIDPGRRVVGGLAHFHAYYMMGNDGASCASDFHCGQNVNVPSCNASQMRIGYGGPGRGGATGNTGGSIEANLRTDYECSNTQWP